jgi:hypothetical protein
VDFDRAGRHAREADDSVDRRRLSGAVWTEEGKKVTRFHAQRNIVDGSEVAVTLDEVRDFDGRRARSSAVA